VKEHVNKRVGDCRDL